jgi:hypothetical protein
LIEASKRYESPYSVVFILITPCKSLKFNYIVAFTAHPFHPPLILPFILEYGQHVLVQQHNLPLAFEHILPYANQLYRHTNIILICKTESGTRGQKLIWTHPILRPWGNEIPIQCGKCCGINTWCKPYKYRGDILIYCTKQGCENYIQFSPPVPVEILKWFGPSVSGGQWLVIDV